MKTLDVVLLVIALLVVVVVAVGARIARRRTEGREEQLQERLAAANVALAAARAEDRGWSREALETAARQAVAPSTPDALHLVQVIDRPGTEADEAVFQAVLGDECREVRLGRTGDTWFAI